MKASLDPDGLFNCGRMYAGSDGRAPAAAAAERPWMLGAMSVLQLRDGREPRRRRCAALTLSSGPKRRTTPIVSPAGEGRCNPFRPEQLADPQPGAGEDPALLRPLRLLHRDLPDLCRHRRRARLAARAHLSDQGPAGERPRADRRRRLADRPLPVVQLLHDDLPVGRRLPPPRRPRARPDRDALQAAAAPTG